MSIDNIKVPEDLMTNIEKKLRSHVKSKKKRRNLYAASIAIVLALGIPVSTLAYNSYINTIPYKQEVDLARQNNMTTKLNTSFKYKGVEFKFKEIVADETGMVVLYNVSDPRYTIGKITMADAEGKAFPEWGLVIPSNDEKNKEKAFYTSVRGDSITYMKNNPITIKINQLNSLSSSKSIDVDWSIKIQVPVQQVRTIPINKEYKLDIGTIKFNSLKLGALKTLVSYDFVPADKSSMMFSPIFSFRIDNEYLDSIHDHTDGANFDDNSIEFKSVYYSKPKEIGIRLLGGFVYYNNNSKKEYFIDKDKLPMEFSFDGENIRVTSMEEAKDSIKYTFEFDKHDRSYSILLPDFNKSTNASVTDDAKVQFIDQVKRDQLYNSLANKVPNFEKIFIDSSLQKAVTKVEVKVPKDAAKSFNITTASKNFLVDLDEIIVKP